jgi:hypothetical protein
MSPFENNRCKKKLILVSLKSQKKKLNSRWAGFFDDLSQFFYVADAD